jgi:hypothetical protein
MFIGDQPRSGSGQTAYSFTPESGYVEVSTTSTTDSIWPPEFQPMELTWDEAVEYDSRRHNI